MKTLIYALVAFMFVACNNNETKNETKNGLRISHVKQGVTRIEKRDNKNVIIALVYFDSVLYEHINCDTVFYRKFKTEIKDIKHLVK